MSQNNLPFKEVRVIFAKTGSAMWFSHLDLMRAVSRALRRSKQQLWMSEGFTPRPHIVFTPPLSLGYESTGEIMDFRLTLDAVLDVQAIKNAFPPALEVKDVYVPRSKQKEIVYADYVITLDTNIADEKIAELFSKPIEMVKKTKRGESVTDITTLIERFEVKDGVISVTVCCGAENTLNPSYILKALEQIGVNTEYAHVCRTGFRKSDMNLFK